MKMRRVLALVMVLCLLVGQLPATAWAAEEETEVSTEAAEATEATESVETTEVTETTEEDAEIVDSGTCGENVTWTLDSNGLLTICGTGPMADYDDTSSPFNGSSAIKSVVIEEGITEIGNSVFFDCAKLLSVSIPTGVTRIGDNAFWYCTRLERVSVPASVTSIEQGAFTHCYDLNGIWVDEGNVSYSSDAYGVLFNKGKTELICMPGAISSYIVPDSVTSIGDRAFKYCVNLTDVTIPSSVVNIGEDAFYGCRAMTSVSIPASVTSIGQGALTNCKGLTGIWVDEENASYSSDAYGVLFNKDKTELICAPGTIGDYTIPNGVTDICLRAFNNCDQLNYVTLPDTVTTIGSGAFGYSNCLMEIVIPAGVTVIESCAFSNCTSLSEITFQGDAPVMEDTESLFKGVTATVYYPAGNETWTEEVMQNYGGTLTWTKNQKFDYPVLVLDTEATAEVPDDGYAYFQFTPEVTESYCFFSLTEGDDTYGYLYDDEMNQLASDDDGGESTNFSISYVLEAGVTYVLAARYYNWGSGSFPVQLQTAHSYVSEIVTEPTCTETGLQRYTCQYCGDAYEETIAAGHSYGEDGICTGCGEEWFETGTCGNNVSWNLNYQGVLTISGAGTMTDYGYEDYPSPFHGTRNIKTVIIEEGVTSVGSRAFWECYGLESVSIADSVTVIGEEAFSGCTKLSSVELGEGVQSINYYAFGSCSKLASIMIPASVRSIDSQAFENACSQGIWVDEANTTYANDTSGVLFNKAMTQLIKAPRALTGDYSVPEGVTRINAQAFIYCSGLTAVTLPESLENIGYWAFGHCSSLTSVSIPANVTNIGHHAFYGSCSQGIWVDEANTAYTSDASGVLFDKAMTRLFKAPSALEGEYEIPESVETIENAAFIKCSNLTSVVMHDAVTAVSSQVFGYCSKLKTITLSQNLVEISSLMFSECYTLESVIIPESVTRISSQAFSECYALTSIVIPASVTALDYGAFGGCTGLEEITFAGDAPTIGSYVFAGVKAVAYYPVYEENWTSDVMQNYGGTLTWEAYGLLASGECGEALTWMLSESGKLIISGSGDMTDYSDTAAPWSEYTVTSVVIESGVTSISSGAFAGCGELTKIVFQGDAPTIGETAFEGVTAEAFYPEGNTTWTEEVMQNYGGTLTWTEQLKLSYPVIERDTVTVVEVPEENYVYFQFTPKYTETYFFYSLATDCDPYAALLDSDMNWLTESDDYENLNFGITYTLEAGVTYVLRIASYSGESSVPVMLQTQHENVTEIVTEASCSVSGLRRHTCQICGEVTEESYFLDHTYGEDDLCTVCGAEWALTGTCGDNVTWSMNRAGELTVSGSGNMTNYGWGGSPFAYNSSITSAVIEEGVTSIGNFAFQKCSNLQTVSIAGSVTNIGESAFRYCSSLQSVTISEGVVSIGERAFYNSGIISVTIPASVISIGQAAFAECFLLDELLVNENSESYCTDDCGVLFNKAMTELLWAPVNTSGIYTVPEGVEVIGSWAFTGCYGMTEVVLPNSLTTICDSAFQNCNGLTKIEIPANVAAIGSRAFAVCFNLTGIWVDEANTVYSSDSSGVLFNKDKTHLIQAPICLSGAYSVPAGVTSFEERAFEYCRITAVTIPEGVTELSCCLFMSCSQLTSVSIPESVTLIDYDVFHGCSSLKDLYIPAGVTSIADGLCHNCDSLTGIWVDEDNPSYSSDSFGVLFNKDKTTLRKVPTGKSGNYQIPDTVVHIEYNAFSGCGLARIIVPSSVADIWWGAFNQCDSLTEITFQGDAPYLDGDIFYDVTATAYYPVGNDTWTEDVLQDYGGNITWVAAEMGSCGDGLYWTLADGVLMISGSGDMADYSETAVPWRDYEITSVTISSGVTSISNGAFAGCVSLTKIYFEGDAPAIGETAFEGITAEAFCPENNTTWTEDVLQNYGGTITWITGDERVSYTGMSLSLNGDIGVNFYVTLADELLADENLRMVFNVGGKTQEMALADALTDTQDDGSIWYRFSCSVPAKGMSDEITAQLYGTDGAIGQSKTYSVAAYYDDICQQFDREEKEELFALIESMLNYGAASQEYFGYNTDHLANAAVTTAVPETVDASAFANAVADTDKLLDYVGASLVLDTTTTLRVFFRPVNGADLSNYTFTVNGETVTAVQRGSLWYIELTNIAAKDLDTAYTFAAGDVTVECSALSYVNNVLNKADTLDAKLVAVCKALYAYNEAANTYFSK